MMISGGTEVKCCRILAQILAQNGFRIFSCGADIAQNGIIRANYWRKGLVYKEIG